MRISNGQGAYSSGVFVDSQNPDILYTMSTANCADPAQVTKKITGTLTLGWSGPFSGPIAPFADAVKRVALVAERNTPVRLSFSAGQLMLEAGTGDEAQAEEVIEAEFSGDDLSIAFNPQYLLDGLAAIDSDTVRISFTEPGKPALLTGKPGPDGNPEFRYLLMPIRLGG